MFRVIKHRSRKYIDPITGKKFIATLMDEIRKCGLPGADMTAFVSFMNATMMRATLGAYRKYACLFDVCKKYCMAHLIRDIRFLAEHTVKYYFQGPTPSLLPQTQRA